MATIYNYIFLKGFGYFCHLTDQIQIMRKKSVTHGLIYSERGRAEKIIVNRLEAVFTEFNPTLYPGELNLYPALS